MFNRKIKKYYKSKLYKEEKAIVKEAVSMCEDYLIEIVGDVHNVGHPIETPKAYYEAYLLNGSRVRVSIEWLPKGEYKHG